MTLPDLVPMLSPLFQLTDSRLSNFKKLLRLSGRLDLALSQVSLRGQSTKSLRHPLVTFTEEATGQRCFIPPQAVANFPGSGGDDDDMADESQSESEGDESDIESESGSDDEEDEQNLDEDSD